MAMVPPLNFSKMESAVSTGCQQTWILALALPEQSYITSGQPCPALACSSSVNEGFGLDSLRRGRDSTGQGRFCDLLLVVKKSVVSW